MLFCRFFIKNFKWTNHNLYFYKNALYSSYHTRFNKMNSLIIKKCTNLKMIQNFPLSLSSFKLNNDKKSSLNNDHHEFDFIDDLSEQDIENSLTFNNVKFCLKNILYSDENDELLQELNNCEGSKNLMEIFSKRFNDFKNHHLVQIVILLWNFERNAQSENELNLSSTLIESNEFQKFLNTLNEIVIEMNLDELTCCLLYLNKFGIDIGHPIMRNILQKILDRISDFKADIPLTVLSRFTVAVNTNPDLYTFLVCKDVMPHITKKIKECNTTEDIRLITICLYNLHHMIDKELLEMYKNKITDLINLNIINNQSVRCLLKIINFLNFPHWTNECTELIRKLSFLLAGQNNSDTFSIKEIETMFKLYQIHLEPAIFIKKLSNITLERIFNDQQISPELLACASYFSPQIKRNQLIQLAEELINNKLNYKNSSIITTLFLILRSLKISDKKLCDTYWENTLNMILNSKIEIRNLLLARNCHRYMHFNNNLGGTYRNKNFENELNDIILMELTNGMSSLIPTRFARLSSFLIAYGYRKHKHLLPNIIINKIENMSNQFTILDCLQLSRGIQIALGIRYRYFIPPETAQQFLRIENVLNKCAERHLQCNLNLTDLNCVIRSLANRKATYKTHLYKIAIEKYKLENIQNEINSRTIRDISLNLLNSKYLIPEIIEKMYEYLIKNREYVSGDTVEKILNCSYKLGYTPENDDALYWSAEIIKRDFEYMTGLSIVQACLSLCFYKVLPESLINKIFNIDFIRQLEDEIQMGYSKATYPEKVLNQVMQLNRAVCLDFPESEVPWFQQNYVEAQMSKKPVIQTHFHVEMKKMLNFVLKSEKFLECNRVTPYGYTIDFVIHLDKNKKPILPPSESKLVENVTRIAILLLRMDSFCQNDNTSLLGHEHLKMRHLEMLGYKVIHINLNDWNSMYMSVPGEKMKYLKNLLQIE